MMQIYRFTFNTPVDKFRLGRNINVAAENVEEAVEKVKELLRKHPIINSKGKPCTMASLHELTIRTSNTCGGWMFETSWSEYLRGPRPKWMVA
jgi:hypothetical protein